MNQDQVKEKIISLGIGEEDFELIFTGKQSQKVNGLYRPDTKEILIHNRNFDNDNMLMLTALHEYTHHVGIVRKILSGKSAHPVAFWGLFHNIIEVAIKKEVYVDVFCVDETLSQVDRKVAEIADKQVAAQRELGMALLEMQNLCKAKGARFEDYLDRHARVPRDVAKAAVAAQLELFEMQKVSPQMIELVASIDGEEKRAEAVARIGMGQSIAQVKAIVKQGKNLDPFDSPAKKEEDLEDVLDRLTAERKKLNEKLQGLTLELQSLDATIAGIREKLPHLVFDGEEAEEDENEYEFDEKDFNMQEGGE